MLERVVMLADITYFICISSLTTIYLPPLPRQDLMRHVLKGSKVVLRAYFWLHRS